MTSKVIFKKRSILASALLISQTLFLTPLAAFAADGDGNIRVAGQTIFTVPADGKITASARAQTIQQNLDNALVAAKDRSPSSVNITYVKGVPVVTVAGYQVVTVDGTSAKALKTSPSLLAKKWGDSIRNSLADQASVSSYVAQLSGDYSSSAPPIQTSPAASPVAYQPQQAEPPAQAAYQSQAPANNQQPSSYQPQNGPQGNYQQPVNYSTSPNGPNYPPAAYGQPQGGYRQGHVAYAPAGMTMNVTLTSGISTTVAKAGDTITANLSQPLVLGDATIPAGSVLEGTVTDASNGKMLDRSGSLGIKFNRIRTPDGVETPISAHITGGIGKYTPGGKDDVMHGETWKSKVGQGVIRTGVGAGAGAALGTAVGAIAGGMAGGPFLGGHMAAAGAGAGAWSGAAIGGTVGLADSILLRKGKEVNIPAGTSMQLQLDQAVSFSGNGTATAGQAPYNY